MIPPKLEPGGKYKWVVVALLWWLMCLNYMDRVAIFSLFPPLRQEMGMSDIVLALLGSTFLWAYGLSSPLGGYLGDRFRRRDVILASLFVFSLVTIATGLAQSRSHILALRVLLGISQAPLIPVAAAYVADYHPDSTRSFAIALMLSGADAGGILGGTFAGYMGDHYTWRSAFYVLGAAGVLLTIIFTPLLRETIKGGSDSSRPPVIQDVHTEPVGQKLRAILTKPTVLVVIFCGMACSISGWVVVIWMPLYMYEKFGMTLTQAGFNANFYSGAAVGVGVISGSLLADHWAKRDPRWRMLVELIGLIVATPALLAIGFAGSLKALLIYLVLFGFGRGFWESTNMPIFCYVVKPAGRATTYGLYNLAATIGGSTGVLLAGMLKASFGIGYTLSAMSSLLVVSLILTWFGITRFLPNDMRKYRQEISASPAAAGEAFPTAT